MMQDQSPLPQLKPEFTRKGANSKSVKSSSVLSVRVSAKERFDLERKAAGENLSTYVRSVLFSTDGSKPVKAVEYKQAVAQAMGRLGKSPHVGTLQGVLRACDDGALALNEDAEIALRKACAQIEDVRRDLLEALGLRPK